MSSRWGEEEKKSKGIVGCLIAIFILGLFSFTFYTNYESFDGRRQLEKEMQDIIRAGYAKSEDEMVSAILEAADKRKIVLEEDQIMLTKSLDDHSNPVVDVKIDFNFTVDLFVTEFSVNMPISEKVTIVFF